MKQFIKPHSTLIIGNGEKPALTTLLAYKNHALKLVALDGAYDWLIGHNLYPDVVVGDMDSIAKNPSSQTSIIHVHDQDSNDLEKALHYCLLHNHSEATIMGAFGLRIDHFLTNLFALKQFASSLSLNMVDDHQCAFICPAGQLVSFDNLLGSSISLFPLNDKVGPITTTGVAYPLRAEFLSLDHRIGTLNSINERRATLSCEQGSLLVVLSQNPWLNLLQPH